MTGSVQVFTIVRVMLVMALFIFCFTIPVHANEALNRLCRVELKSREQYTRITLVFAAQPRYQVSYLSANRVQLTFQNTGGSLLKKLQDFSDSRLERILLTDQGDRLRLRLTLKDSRPGIRILDHCLPNTLSIDIGNALRNYGEAAMPPGRDQIWSGAAKLIREFDPPLTSEIPFFPTPGILIRKIMSPEDTKIFLRGEEALFREQGAEAEELFTEIIGRVPAARGIAAYRLGEAQYLLQKYQSALTWFREGERISPEFMVQSPSIVFSYADSLARCGDSAGGRRMLDRMIVGMADTKYGPVLLVRLADILTRGGKEMDAVAVYASVVKNFPGTRAAYFASTRLADRRLFTVNSGTFSQLAAEYNRIYRQCSDQGLKEEALFKWALVTALYGPVSDAVAAVTEYGGKFPAGVFINVAGSMREDLVLELYHELDRADDCRSLVKLALDHRSYLFRCVQEKEFIPRIAGCFEKLGMIREGLTLFSQLAETEWAGPNTPFLYDRIVEHSWLLEDFAMAAAAARTYLASFSKSPAAGKIRERLAWIEYRNRNLSGVYSTLSPLMNGTLSIDNKETYYLYGKACESVKDYARAQKAMELYLDSTSAKSGSALSADARLVIASAKAVRGDTAGALAILKSGLDASRDEWRDMYLYKMGEFYRQEGNLNEAKNSWEQLVKEGKDPVWKSMAYQALSDMSWSESKGKGTRSK